MIIEVENAEGKLKSGMNMNIEITIIKKENILLAPAIALRIPKRPGMKQNVRMVMLKDGEDFKPQKVEIGLSNFKQAEILSGLEEGSVLGVPMNSRLKEDNDRREDRIKSTRSFGTGNRQSSR